MANVAPLSFLLRFLSLVLPSFPFLLPLISFGCGVAPILALAVGFAVRRPGVAVPVPLPQLLLRPHLNCKPSYACSQTQETGGHITLSLFTTERGVNKEVEGW